MFGSEEKQELTVEATVDNLEKVTSFVNEQLENLSCPMKAQMQIDIAIDELFSNIAYYAYQPKTGNATVQIEVVNEPLAVVITFIDEGTPYDPLSRENPDTSLSAEERQIGGLGIYMVRKSMDEISYEYREGKNILKIKKQF
ncbi:MAG: ATP-binding protein [Eubacterium sp.]|nr:ATP-binding protein [Eubacterium sp.]